MKYIRTIDGIYKIALTDKIRFGQYYCYKVDRQNINQYSIIAETSILNQADTIEELCDGFYIDVLGDGTFNFDGLYLYNDFDDFKAHYISYHNYDDVENGYGFIKTRKGLIYVAKMDDEGELELI